MRGGIIHDFWRKPTRIRVEILGIDFFFWNKIIFITKTVSVINSNSQFKRYLTCTIYIGRDVPYTRNGDRRNVWNFNYRLINSKFAVHNITYCCSEFTTLEFEFRYAVLFANASKSISKITSTGFVRKSISDSDIE